MKAQKLTKRQLEIAEAIGGKGMSAKMAADALNVSHHTVNNTLKVIYRRLEINSAVEMTIWYQNRNQARVISMYPTVLKEAA